MSVYTVPSLSAVDFALTVESVPDISPYEIGLTSYTVPSLSAVDFALTTQTLPTFQDVGWELLPTAGGDATIAITGVTSTGQVGTVTATGTAATSITGVSGTGAAGTVTAVGTSPDATVAISGVEGTGQAGTVTATGGASVSITGISGTAAAGTTAATGAANVSIAGVEGSGAVGDVIASAPASGDATVAIEGVSGTGQVGDVSASASSETAQGFGGWARLQIRPRKSDEELKAELTAERIALGILPAPVAKIANKIAQKAIRAATEVKAPDVLAWAQQAEQQALYERQLRLELSRSKLIWDSAYQRLFEIAVQEALQAEEEMILFLMTEL